MMNPLQMLQASVLKDVIAVMKYFQKCAKVHDSKIMIDFNFNDDSFSNNPRRPNSVGCTPDRRI